MAKTYDILTSQAETIRTNTLPNSNTAGLVGQMLKDIIEKVSEVNTSSSGAVTAINVSPTADANSVILTLSVQTGEKVNLQSVNLPVVSASAAGVITPAQMSSITSSLNTMSRSILEISNNYNAQKKTVDGLQDSIQTLTDEIEILKNSAVTFYGTVMVTALKMSSIYYSTDENCRVVYNLKEKVFVLEVDKGTTSYYNNWRDGDAFGKATLAGRAPRSGKMYVDVSEQRSYVWCDDELILVGTDLELGHEQNTAFPGDEGADMKSRLSTAEENLKAFIDSKGVEGGIAPLDINGIVPENYLPDMRTPIDVIQTRLGLVPFVNVSRLVGGNYTLETAIDRIYRTTSIRDLLVVPGLMITYRKDSTHWEIKQYTSDSTSEADFRDTEKWQDVGGGGTSSSVFNPTVSYPISGFYALYDPDNAKASAVDVAWNAGKVSFGLLLTIQVSKKIWKTYQYIGTSLTIGAWQDPVNWQDFGSLAAGSETYININNLIDGNGKVVYYTLSSAVAALISYQQSTAVNYIKRGLIISFLSETNKTRSFQFHGDNIADASKTDTGATLWREFGKSEDINLSDTPVKDGKDPYSTGGAYTNTPTDIDIVEEDGGVYKFALTNADGNQIGEQRQIVIKGGGGAVQATTVSIALKMSTVYGAVGSTMTIEAAIMSVTSTPSGDSLNSITRVDLVDRSTNAVLQTLNVNTESSANLTDDFKFKIDISEYFATTAGSRSFRIVAYDDGDHSGNKNVSAVGVDATVVSQQTLNYTSSTMLKVNGAAVSVPLYSFPNNASSKGIKATVEMYYSGAWHTIDETVVTDVFTHAVNLDPKALGLTHGSYPLRIHGVDVASGVSGNWLYSGIMVVNEADDTPLVVMRWYDDGTQTRKLFQTVSVDVAAYTSGKTKTAVDVMMQVGENAATVIAQQQMSRDRTYTVTKRLSGMSVGSQLKFYAMSGDVRSAAYDITVAGSIIPIETTAGAIFDLDMSSRSNSDSDKTISDNGVNIEVSGANYTTNGFVRDNYGSDDYGQTDANGNPLGRMALRIAENVTAKCDFKPWSNASTETTGMALSFTIKPANVADSTARLIDALGDGQIGFYVTGDKVVFTCDGEQSTMYTATMPLKAEKVTRVDIVIEPSAVAPYQGIGVVKIFGDGEERAACAYSKNALPMNDNIIRFDGTLADLYLYQLTAWRTYYQFRQAFNNYLAAMPDTDAMVKEYEANDVMASQTAENTTKDRPTIEACKKAGLCVMVMVKNKNTADTEDQYPGYLDTLDGDKKTKRILDFYLYFPDRPWQDCYIEGATASNQGTTSSMRPDKNKKIKTKSAKITLLHKREEFSGADLAKYDEALANAKKSKIKVLETSVPTNIITFKVDYSDCTGANNGASCELNNRLIRALGAEYMQPSQNAYTGKAEINPSIASVPCAFFRTDKYSPDATNPAYAYFHVKANLNEDKGDAKVFGFEDVDGYNKSCMNYGDFKELVAERDQDFNEFKAQTLANTSKLQAGDIYMLSEFCGPKTAFIENDGTGHFVETSEVADALVIERTLAELLSADVKSYDWSEVYKTSDGKYAKYEGGKWKETTGSMTYDKTTKRWQVTGRVLNPTQCYEHLKYNGLNWYQGVNSVDDMLRLDPATGKPIWLSHFESRYPDDDNLNALYESGKKVPYYFYENLMWMQQCNPHLTEADGNITLDGKTVPGTRTNRAKKFAHEMHRYWRVKPALYYYILTDYENAVDQRSKNMMQTFMLCEDGVIRSDFNNWYDGDCTLGADNDCALTISALLNPLLVGEGEEGRLYQGWDSVFFQRLNENPVIWLDDYKEGDEKSGYTDKSRFVTLHDVADEMRKAVDKQGLKVFSYDGLYQIWMTKRILKWAKVISSFDGERKYIQHSKANANYFFALHGLRLDDMPEYIKTRFAYRDGYYQVGDLYTKPMKMRASGKAITVSITAAKDGFFGIGEDRADTAADSTYLKRGKSYTFFNDSPRSYSESGTMLYVFGAASLASLDISAATPKSQGWDIQYCKLLQHLVVGDADYVPYTVDGTLDTLNLDNMPFLQSLDVRNTLVASVDASMCPRLTSIKADGSRVQSVEVAETSPITELTLPATLKTVKFINLPNLSYTLTGGNLQIASLANVQTLRIEHCNEIEPFTMLQRVVDAQTGNRQLTAIRVVQTLSGDGSLLALLLTLGVRGITEDGKLQDKPVVESDYQLTRVREQSYIDDLTQHIEGLTIVMSIMAYINAVIDFLGEQYSGEAEVEDVSLDNINDYLKQYNGETYDDYYNRLAEADDDILNIIDK